MGDSDRRPPGGLGPWAPAKATEIIWERAKQDVVDICWTDHARDQIRERGLIMGDVLHLLRKGYVYDVGEPASRGGVFKYKLEGKTPNSNNRFVRVVVIPSPQACMFKIVSVMWADEPLQSS